jgi:hypothetical protein
MRDLLYLSYTDDDGKKTQKFITFFVHPDVSLNDRFVKLSEIDLKDGKVVVVEESEWIDNGS